MTGQRTQQMDRGQGAAREVESLLATGPFAAALRAAIRARGLGLERIQYRLRRRGVPVSLATLSHWQSGRCRPERPGSLAALKYLEEVLEVPQGSLLRLLAVENGGQRVTQMRQ
ncbi:transcriptional regulator [Prauserella cavernicola]|uniref:Transcriptional regulator n=1 Tax=Prauserella cavernicola TaxID=2800127 RepID=A0A934V4I6_9PSEU|nr:transcriptional regulator [Prauserella cavernicola]MBK1785457.1 transcriptional regulator [Prauserella cavernicola]